MLQRKRHTERFSLHWFTSQMATTARAGADQRQQPRASSLGIGAQAVGPCSVPAESWIGTEAAWSSTHMGGWHYRQQLYLLWCGAAP